MHDPIRYQLRFPHAAHHYVEVSAVVPGDDPELYLPVWTPGSYLIREHSQHVEEFSARDAQGTALRWRKTRKNRWKVEGAGPVTVGYRVYGRTLGVQSNFIEAGFGLLNGATTFLTLVGGGARPHEVAVELPANWQGAYTGLDEWGPGLYRAADYDTLVDCPIYLGSPRVYEFEAAARKHYLVNEGEHGVWNGPESAAALERIVREYQRMMGVVPYERYLFLNLLVETGGGLEHKNSTVLFASRWAWSNNEEAALDAPPPRKPNRTNWLDLASHEYFHLWNVKRLRPVELGPFDYENENYTRTLWVAEGMTTYYGPLAVKRAGLIDRPTYLNLLSREITQLQTTPGRLLQPLETSSFDAWIKLYRHNENSVNTVMSYYTKGAVVAWLIDARIQEATDGGKSLDDAMRLAYERFSGDQGFTSAEFRGILSEVAGEDLSAGLTAWLETTAELDYAPALAWFGLRFAEGKPGAKAYLGATLKNNVVTNIPRGTPAFAAGLNVDDELLAINQFRVRPEGPNLERHSPGDRVEILVARRGQLVTLAAVLTPEPRKVWQLEADPAAGPAAEGRLARWLGEDWWLGEDHTPQPAN